MDKFDVARALDQISRYIELSDPNPFKARAFERAARAVEALEGDLDTLIAEGGLKGVSGIGKATSVVIEELVATQTSQYLEELRSQYPPGIFELLRIPGLGLKKIGLLHAELGIGSIDALEEAAKSGRLATLKGFGAKTAQKMLEGVEFARKRESLFLLPSGLDVAATMRERVAALEGVDAVEISGAVRRRLEVVGEVELVIATRDAEAVARRLEKLVSNLEAVDGNTWRGLSRGDVPVVLHLTVPGNLGSTLLRTTGSSEFVAAFGDIPEARDEADAFKEAGIAFVAPERRENADDLTRKRRTRLLELDDIRGTFHVHTTFSDGRNSVEEMLAAASARGLEYVGLSDHSPAAYYAGGLTVSRLKEQHAEIAHHETAFAPMRVFRGTEADILQDGSIDYDDATLETLDFVIASVHSNFKTPKDEMTDRFLKAIDNPHVTFLGHLTGRKLLSRAGYEVDFDQIFDKAADRGVMIEINGNPNRLDVDWRHLRRAVDRGVVFSIHPDAHSTGEYDAVVTGTWVARKAGLAPKHIFNTKSREEVEEFFAERKKKRVRAAKA